MFEMHPSPALAGTPFDVDDVWSHHHDHLHDHLRFAERKLRRAQLLAMAAERGEGRRRGGPRGERGGPRGGGPRGGRAGGPRGGGPRGRGGPGGWGGRGGRMRRGDVRTALLALLAERPRHGYDLMQELSRRTGGIWRPSPGSVYPTLAQLEDEGLIVASEADGKRVFTLTDAGREEADRHDGPAPWDEVNDEVGARGPGGDRELLREAALVMAAAKQFRHLGSPDQSEAAARVLADARRHLYRLLAADPEE